MSDAGLSPYIPRREELSLQDGCILWGSRVIVPPRLRPRLLEKLHMGHSGFFRMKELAHSLHIDYAGPVNGRYFLLIVDAHSKWVDFYPTSGTTAKEIL